MKHPKRRGKTKIAPIKIIIERKRFWKFAFVSNLQRKAYSVHSPIPELSMQQTGHFISEHFYGLFKWIRKGRMKIWNGKFYLLNIMWLTRDN